MVKYEDLKCEFCDGNPHISRDNSDGMAIEYECTFCNGTGIDKAQLFKAFCEQLGTDRPCGNCHCSIEVHNADDQMRCPNYAMGKFNGYLDTTFIIAP